MNRPSGRNRLRVIAIFVTVFNIILFGFTLIRQSQPPERVILNVDGSFSNVLPTATPMPFVEIVIAVQELPRGMRIPPNAVTYSVWPESLTPFNAITNIEDVIGTVARTDIYREQPILRNLVSRDLTSLASVGSDAAALLPPGLTSVTLRVNMDDVSEGIETGDRVDLIYSFEFLNVDQDFQSQQPNIITLLRPGDGDSFESQGEAPGRFEDLPPFGQLFSSPSEAQRPRLTTQRVIQDALVIYVGDIPQNRRIIGVPPTPTPVPIEDNNNFGNADLEPTMTPVPESDTVTLTIGVTSQEAVVVVWAKRAGVPVYVTLRSASDTSRTLTDAVTLDYLMHEYDVPLPPQNPYTIEATEEVE